MSFYDHYILPHVINCACSSKPVLKQRQHIVPKCSGVVLEIGMGSGINLQYYNADQVDFVWGLEPSMGMRQKAAKNVQNSPVEVKWLDLPSEQIPLPDNTIDTVLLTYTLCTIGEPTVALKEMKRVLKPEGQLLFCEHGLAPDSEVERWQNRINPYWNKIAGGCNLNRPIEQLLQGAGFTIEQQEQFYLKKTPRFAGYTYTGNAKTA